MAPKTRIKAKAKISVPQSKDAAAADISKIGELQRKIVLDTAAMNDAIAVSTAKYQPGINAANEQIEALQSGVQAWCEAHRTELTNDGKVKTANLITGSVSWRFNPPSVKVTGAESVIKALLKLRLKRFVRVTVTVNKEAILNEPDAVKDVDGITVVKDVEEFVITPFEQEVAA